MSEKRLTRARIPGWPIAAALAVLFLYFYYVRIVLLPFVFAGAIAFILSPAIDRLQGKVPRTPRWAVAVAVYLLFLAIVAALAVGLGPALVEDATQIMRAMPEALRRALAFVAPSGQIAFMGSTISTADLIHDAFNGMRAYLLSGAGLSLAASAFAGVVAVFLTGVLLAYFLISGPTLGRGLMWLVPPEYREQAREVTRGVEPMLRRYFIGLLVIVSYASAISWLFFGGIFGIAHAPLLSLLIGVLELVPILGPTLSAALVVAAALQQTTLATTVGFIVFLVVLRLSIDQIIGPLVLGQAAYLHPVVVIFAFLTGGIFLGVLGLVLAVPTTATIKIVLEHYYRERLSEGEPQRARRGLERPRI